MRKYVGSYRRAVSIHIAYINHKHLFPNCPNRLRRQASLIFNGSAAIAPGVKKPGRNADHSLPSSVEVKNEYTSTPPICLHGAHTAHITSAFGVVFPSPSSSHKGHRKFVSSYVAYIRTPTFIPLGYFVWIRWCIKSAGVILRPMRNELETISSRKKRLVI